LGPPEDIREAQERFGPAWLLASKYSGFFRSNAADMTESILQDENFCLFCVSSGPQKRRFRLVLAHFAANGDLEMVPAVEAAGGVSGGAFPSAHRSNRQHFIS
jgi:hypothetical protein